MSQELLKAPDLINLYVQYTIKKGHSPNGLSVLLYLFQLWQLI